MSDHIDGILETIGSVTRGLAVCPAHPDSSPSMSVKIGTKGLLLYCHAGCSLDDICAALGVPKHMLFFDWTPHTIHSTHPDLLAFRSRFRQLQNTMNGIQPRIFPMDRFDDVLWTAYPTTPEYLSWVAIKWYPLLETSWVDAEKMWVITSNGPVFDYLQPTWQSEGRPNWHTFKRTVLRKLQSTWRTNQPTILT